ncbi:SprT-like protease [Streptomyces phage StarPlatinum]|uniref:SprT-like protease n=1 Tax=Streptomyces phage StarPlatinum TaxID=2283265 RepID=A0A345M8W1_9CAUD|nr:SprT-like protease [Streptomyces phage StarPlatinum]AXH66932.1 SprT-like protease [Streptomyces phage StarPlatinum]
MNLIRAERLARDLMWEFDLFTRGWDFGWNRMVKTYGTTYHMQKMIKLSKTCTPNLTEDQVDNVIRHEIAHALVGPGHGHNAIWRAKAIEIGCTGNTCENYTPATPKWKAVCPDGHTAGTRYRRPARGRILVCAVHRKQVDWVANG